MSYDRERNSCLEAWSNNYYLSTEVSLLVSVWFG